jgi:hypothetical protein
VKLFGISLLIASILMGVAIGMDMLMGFQWRQSIQNVLNPFRVMETPELFILFLLLILWALDILVALFRQKQRQT